MTLELREADIKATCESFLYSLMNMDKLIYLRLNSGDLIIGEGKYKRRVRCCPKGTADGLIILPPSRDGDLHDDIFVEYKSEKGKQSREQIAFEKKVTSLDCEYWIVKDSEAFIEAIREII
jgi:hypothetical protein